jgi:hypothetical protein
LHFRRPYLDWLYDWLVMNLLWGIRILAYSPAAFNVLPQSFWASRLSVIAILSYLTVIPGLLFFLEMSRGILRRFLQAMLIAEPNGH